MSKKTNRLPTREDIKDYKSACKVLGIRPTRAKLPEHVMVYITISTIIEALNFTSNGYKSIEIKFVERKKSIETFYPYSYLPLNSSYSGLFSLYSNDGLGGVGSTVGSHFKFINKEDGEYFIENFKELWYKYAYNN